MSEVPSALAGTPLATVCSPESQPFWQKPARPLFNAI